MDADLGGGVPNRQAPSRKNLKDGEGFFQIAAIFLNNKVIYYN